MNFNGFYGNERAKEYLNLAFARHSIPHALLIAGERGIGKKTLADIVARAIVCEGDNVPCDKCDSCYKALKNIHPDIIYPATGKKIIGVDGVRDLKKDALLLPNDAERKVYVFENAGTMTHEAQDALLKILEEPPHFTFFILLCSNYSDLLPTIVSRTSHITLSPLSDEDMRRVIAEKLPDISDEEALELIRTSDGVCSFLSDAENSESVNFASDIARVLISRDELAIFRSLSAIEKLGRDALESVLNELIIIIRDSIMILSGAKSRLISQADASVSDNFSHVYPTSVCCELIDIICDAKYACMRNVGVAHITGSLTCKFAHTAANAALKG